MRSDRLDRMKGGWFVGGFEPSVLATRDCEVAVKTYAKGTREAAHFHKVATEVTVILSGQARMAGRTWKDGDIIILDPGDVTDFEALTDVTTVVVKHPGALDDKYLA